MQVVEHGGQATGFGSLLYMVPEHRFAVVILANRTASGRLYEVVDAAMDIVLRVRPATADSTSENVPMTSDEISGYAGKYANNTAVELAVRDGKLLYRENDSELPVTKVGERSFYAGIPGTTGAVFFVLVQGASGGTEFLYKSNMVAHRKVTNE